MITINSKQYETREVIKIEIDGKVYNLPLMKYLKYKTIKKLVALKDSDTDMDAIMDILSTYIPEEVLEELSIAQLTQIIEAWKDVSSEDGEDLGN